METVPPISSPRPAKPEHILYADDMLELRELMTMALTRDGYTVECAPDGLAALEKMDHHGKPFDLVITDHHMPNMNGLEFVSRLRETPYPGKVLVFSSELSQEVNGAYRQLHVDRILYKPVAPSVLRQTLSEIFGLHATKPKLGTSTAPFATISP